MWSAGAARKQPLPTLPSGRPSLPEDFGPTTGPLKRTGRSWERPALHQPLENTGPGETSQPCYPLFCLSSLRAFAISSCAQWQRPVRQRLCPAVRFPESLRAMHVIPRSVGPAVLALVAATLLLAAAPNAHAVVGTSLYANGLHISTGSIV